MGIAPNPAMTMEHLHRQDGSSGSGGGGGGGGRCRRCCRTCYWTRCWRSPAWRHGLALLCGATLLSALVPGAPLARLGLSEDAERHRLLAENEARLQRSQHFLDMHRARQRRRDHPPTRDDSVGVDVGITVLTMARGRRMQGAVTYRTEYLTQSVATLLQLLNDTSLRRSYTLRVCNIDDRPELFQEAQTLEDVLPVFKRYGSAENGNVTPASSRKTSIWEKLKMDYVYCMEQTLALGVRYVLLLEDDAVAHGDLFHVLEHVLEKVIEVPGTRPVAYVKLYHPQRLLGYISLEVERLVELLALSLTLGFFLTCWRGISRAGGGSGVVVLLLDLPKVSYRLVVLRWAGWAVVVAVLALAVGRANLLELRRVSPQLYQVTPTPSCCIPAVLYPRRGALDFAAFLRNVTCTARRSTDIRMDEFREGMEEGRGLLVQPNLFHHIGLVSSLRRKEVNPLMVQ